METSFAHFGVGSERYAARCHGVREVFLGACRREEEARGRKICSPARCSALVGVGEGAGARDLQFGAVAMCSSARVGVGEDAEAYSFINSGRPGALLGSSVAFGSGCG